MNGGNPQVLLSQPGDHISRTFDRSMATNVLCFAIIGVNLARRGNETLCFSASEPHAAKSWTAPGNRPCVHYTSSRFVVKSESVGINNRHVVGNERALRERGTVTPSWP